MVDEREDFRVYWRRVKHNVNQVDLKWARDNLVVSTLLPIIPVVLAVALYGIYPEPKTLVLTIWVYALVLSVFVIVILIRAPWKLSSQDRTTHAQIVEDL